MVGTANLANEIEQFSNGLDPIVIRKVGSRIIGGRTLNVEDYTEKLIKAGHVIIQSKTDENEFKPMPVKDGAYDALPDGYKYAGVLVRTILKDMPLAAIQYDGEINDKACPYPVDSIKAAIKAELPSLYFMHD